MSKKQGTYIGVLKREVATLKQEREELLKANGALANELESVPADIRQAINQRNLMEQRWQEQKGTSLSFSKALRDKIGECSELRDHAAKLQVALGKAKAIGYGLAVLAIGQALARIPTVAAFIGA